MKKSDLYMYAALMFIFIYAVVGFAVVFNYIPLDNISFEKMCIICSPIVGVITFATMYLITIKRELNEQG